MIIEDANIEISVEGGATFTFKPGTPQWGEALDLLRGNFDESEITDPDAAVIINDPEAHRREK